MFFSVGRRMIDKQESKCCNGVGKAGNESEKRDCREADKEYADCLDDGARVGGGLCLYLWVGAGVF